MKYLKTYESLTKDEIVDKILSNLNEISEEEEDYEDFFDCPFINELNLIHQKDYIEDIYDLGHNNISHYDFTTTYKELLDQAHKTIINIIMKKSKMFYKWKKYIDASGISIGYDIDSGLSLLDWYELNKDTNKYNL